MVNFSNRLIARINEFDAIKHRVHKIDTGDAFRIKTELGEDIARIDRKEFDKNIWAKTYDEIDAIIYDVANGNKERRRKVEALLDAFGDYYSENPLADGDQAGWKFLKNKQEFLDILKQKNNDQELDLSEFGKLSADLQKSSAKNHIVKKNDNYEIIVKLSLNTKFGRNSKNGERKIRSFRLGTLKRNLSDICKNPEKMAKISIDT